MQHSRLTRRLLQALDKGDASYIVTASSFLATDKSCPGEPLIKIWRRSDQTSSRTDNAIMPIVKRVAMCVMGVIVLVVIIAAVIIALLRYAAPLGLDLKAAAVRTSPHPEVIGI